MVECWLPYGRTEVHISVPFRDLVRVVEPKPFQPAPDAMEAIKDSVRKPTGAATLEQLVEPGVSIAIAIEGTIVPYTAIAAVSSIVGELKLAGASVEDITIVIGNGCRDRSNPLLLKALKDHEALRGANVVEQGAGSQDLIDLGTTSKGTRVEINGRFGGAGLRIAIGEVLLDALAGFRGAHTTVLPAISSLSTIEANRSLAFDDNASPGVVEGNPVLADILEFTRLVGVDFAVNVIESPQGGLLGAHSGGVEESWRLALSDLEDSYKVEAEADADIIVVSAGGIKFDFDLYHGVWALRGASQIAKKDATIILLAECSEGLGAPGLAKLSHVDNLSELRRRYMLGSEAVHLIKSTIKRNRVVLVSSLPGYLTEPLGLLSARTANDALESAVRGRRERRTLVVTNGCSTLPFAV